MFRKPRRCGKFITQRTGENSEGFLSPRWLISWHFGLETHGGRCVFLSSFRLWWRPLASVDVASPIYPIYLHKIAADGQTIPSRPRDAVRDGGGQSSETLRQHFTQLFQTTAEWKHFLLPLITKIEPQLMKINLGSQIQGLQHGLFHCKHTHTFIHTVPAPTPTPQVPEREPERVLRRVSNGPVKDGEKWWRSIRLSINPPQHDHKEIAGISSTLCVASKPHGDGGDGYQQMTQWTITVTQASTHLRHLKKNVRFASS